METKIAKTTPIIPKTIGYTNLIILKLFLGTRIVKLS